MYKRMMLMLLCLALLAACGGPQAPAQQQGDRSETTISKGGDATPEPYVEPTAAPDATAEPGAEEPTPAQVSDLPVDSGVVIFSMPGSGGVEGISLLDGRALVLADPNMAHPAALPWSLSPDGKTLAVVTGIHMDGSFKNGRLSAAAVWLVGVDESNPRKLIDLVGAELPQDAMQLSGIMAALVRSDYQLLPWTPGGESVVVTSAHEGQTDLYLVPVDGGAPRRLTETPDLEIQPTLSPRGDRVAFASAESFGAGAGWGGVKAASVPLAGGEPASLIGELPPELQPAGVEVLGWSKETAIVKTTDMGGSSTTLWATAEGAPEIIFRTPAQIHATVHGSVLTFATNTYFGQPQGEADGLYQWGFDDEEPRKLADIGGVNSVHVPPPPMGGMALLCLGDDGMSYKAAFWNASELVDLGEGTCGQSVAWSDRGTVAFGSGFMDDAGVRPLSRHALPAGWTEAGVYYFAPTDDTLSQWQLYLQRGDARQPIGEPLAQRPERPLLVRG